MADVEISYKGSTIATTSATGTKTLLTQGKYCEDDIEVSYTKPSKAYINVRAWEGFLLRCGTQSYQLHVGEYEHTFAVDLGVYQIIAEFGGDEKFRETVNADTYTVFVVDFTKVLPSEYQEVEYLESTGTQYIETNLTQANEAKIKYQCLGNYVLDGGIFGSRGTTTNYRFGLVLYNNNFVPLLGSNATLMALYDNNQHVFYLKSGASTFDGIPVENFVSTGLLSTYKQCIFANKLSGQTSLVLIPLKIYYCKFYYSNTLIGDFIPCYRKSDDKPGMYDLVNRIFYTNEGTGEFIVGGNV